VSKSERVTAEHERAIARLVGECHDLGDDSIAWQHHLIAGLRHLTGAGLGIISSLPTYRIPLALAATTEVEGYWASDRVRDKWMRWLRNTQPGDAFRGNPVLRRFFALPGTALTRVRQEYIPDREWGRWTFVNETLRPDEMVEGLISRTPTAVAGQLILIALTHTHGERPFPRVAGRVVHRVQEELAAHYGRALWFSTQPNVAGLSGRLREVLDCLLDGDGEKQVALRLGIHPTTVHDHVKRLYYHFGVSSRAELMAYFLRRSQPRFQDSRPGGDAKSEANHKAR
jgi:DNA-binding CsgD family transcriptional regulator